ncbi:hypothetical protein JYK21_03810 [Ralstonia pickettii]|nr:hypothetical protein [Ralstonia pickettii]
MNCFEDETGKAPDDLSKEEFNALSNDLKWAAYEDLQEMFFGVVGELEESIENFISRMRTMSGTGNGIGMATIKKIEEFAIKQRLIKKQSAATDCEICEGTGIITNEDYEDIHFPDVTCECVKKENS